MHHSPAAKALQNGQQARERLLVQLAAGLQLVGDFTQWTGAVRVDEWEQPLVDEEELPVAVAVAQGAEALRTQCDRVVEADAVAALQSARDQ